MRIDIGGGSQQLIRLSQEQIELVNSNLITSTGALNTKIDTTSTKFQVNSFIRSPSMLSTTSNSTPLVIFNSTINKKYSDTKIFFNVSLNVSRSSNTSNNSYIASLSLFVNNQFTDSTDLHRIQAADANFATTYFDFVNQPNFFSRGFILQPASGNNTIRIELLKSSAFTTLYMHDYSHFWIEAKHDS